MDDQTPRESMKEAEYWEHVKSARLHDRDLGKFYESYQRVLDRDRYSQAVLLLERAYLSNLEAICYLYSAGDSLEHMRVTALSPALESVEFVLDEIEHQARELPFGHMFQPISNAFALHNVYSTLCWLVCFDVDRKRMERLAPYIAPSGQDRFVDLILREYQPDREVASGSASPEVFGLIDRLVDATEDEQQNIVMEHLDGWAGRMRQVKRSLGIGGASHAVLASCNADLVSPAVVDGASAAKGAGFGGFIGWWAWEVALAVKVLGIDDSAFEDHELYPVDMVRHSLSHADDWPWPLKGDGLLVQKDDTPSRTNTTAVAGAARDLSELFDELDLLEQAARAGKRLSHEDVCRLENICEQLEHRSDAAVWVPRLVSLIETTPDGADIDESGALTAALESTWPLYLDELFSSIERQPRGVSMNLADRVVRGEKEMLEKWRTLFESVRDNPDASADAREVADEILYEDSI